MKKYIARIVVMLLIASVLPLQVSAAEKESIELAVEAEQVGVSLTLPQSVSGNILSLQVGLKVDSNVQEETTATFQFSENVAKVADYRYNQEKGILNIYLSGTKTLFQNGTESLKLGNVQINTTNENGATVHVSVVEDSVKMVKGTKTEVIQNIDYPEKAEIILGNGGNQDNGGDPDNGGDQNNGEAQDKTELQQVMEMAKSYTQSEYTKESYAVLQKAMEMAREEGLKVGMLRPITLWPFPTKAIAAYADKVKGILVTELNAGQMIEDVRLAVNGKVKVEHFGRLGGIVPDPDEVITSTEKRN